MSPDLRSVIEDLEVRLLATRARADQTRAGVERARERRAWALELLQIDEGGAPLPLTPLLGAVAAALGALTAGLGAYAVCLGGDACWGALASLGLFIGTAGLVVARRPGAGGSARALLTRFAWIVGLLALFAFLAGITSRHRACHLYHRSHAHAGSAAAGCAGL